MEALCKWTGRYKDNWKDAFERMLAWWNFEETDRPIVLNPVPRAEHERRGSLIYPVSPDEARGMDFNADVYINNARYSIENTIYTGESAPLVRTGYASSLGMLAVMAGGRVAYDTRTAWVEADEGTYERELPVFDPDSSPYAFTIDMLHRYHAEFGADVVLGANPMVDPFTTLSVMRGVEDFCVDLIERPGVVARWTKRLGDIYIGMVEGFRIARADLGRREDANWCGVWAPGDMDTVMCDAAAYLSPEMFRKFVMEEAEREAEFFDYALWHLDGTGQFIHLPDICSIPNIRAIQFGDEKARDPLEFAHIWEKVIKAGKSLVISCPLASAIELTKKLGKRGLALGLSDVKTTGEMEKALKILADI